MTIEKLTALLGNLDDQVEMDVALSMFINDRNEEES